jgi:twitching motility protein PilT
LPKANSRGRALACEIMVPNSAIRSLIREDKCHQIYSHIQAGAKTGMRTMNQSLFELYRAGTISYEDALEHTGDEADFQRLMERTGSTAGGMAKRPLR